MCLQTWHRSLHFLLTPRSHLACSILERSGGNSGTSRGDTSIEVFSEFSLLKCIIQKLGVNAFLFYLIEFKLFQFVNFSRAKSASIQRDVPYEYTQSNVCSLILFYNNWIKKFPSRSLKGNKRQIQNSTEQEDSTQYPFSSFLKTYGYRKTQ